MQGSGNMEVKSEEFSSDRLELTVGVKTSKRKMSLALSTRRREGREGGRFDEREQDSDDDHSSKSVYVKVEPPQKDTQRGEDKGTVAAQTQMPSTKPKASTPVACRQLIDGNKAASLRDQTPFSGGQGPAHTDPNSTSSVQASFTQRNSLVPRKATQSVVVKASVSAAQRDEGPPWNKKPCNNREERKREYYRELGLQVEERKQQIERERRRDNIDEQKHNQTMQNSIWGLAGGGAPNYHLGSTRRTRSLAVAGIVPQEQIRDRGFSGTPFHLL